MDIDVKSDDLREAIGKVCRLSHKGSGTQALLLGTKFGLEVQGTVGDIGIASRMLFTKGSVIGETVSVGASLLWNLLRTLPGEDLTVRTQAPHGLHIETKAGAKFHIPILESLPPIPEAMYGSRLFLEMPTATFRSVTSSLLPFAWEGEDKDRLRSVFLHSPVSECPQRKARFVATDTHRLALYDTDLDAPDDFGSVIIPPEALRLWRRIAPRSEMMTIRSDDKVVELSSGGTRLTAAIPQENYADYNKAAVIPRPEQFIATATLDIQQLRTAIRAADALAAEGTRKTILTFEGMTLRISDDDCQTYGWDMTVPVKGMRAESIFQIAVNTGFLLDALDALKGAGTVHFGFTGVTTVMLIRAEPQSEVTCALMPMWFE